MSLLHCLSLRSALYFRIYFVFTLKLNDIWMNGTITQCTQHCFMIKTTVCSNFNMCNEKRVTSNVFNSKTREINHHCAFISCYFIGKMCSTIFLFIIHYLIQNKKKWKQQLQFPEPSPSQFALRMILIWMQKSTWNPKAVYLSQNRTYCFRVLV